MEFWFYYIRKKGRRLWAVLIFLTKNKIKYFFSCLFLFLHCLNWSLIFIYFYMYKYKLVFKMALWNEQLAKRRADSVLFIQKLIFFFYCRISIQVCHFAEAFSLTLILFEHTQKKTKWVVLWLLVAISDFHSLENPRLQISSYLNSSLIIYDILSLSQFKLFFKAFQFQITQSS